MPGDPQAPTPPDYGPEIVDELARALLHDGPPATVPGQDPWMQVMSEVGRTVYRYRAQQLLAKVGPLIEAVAVARERAEILTMIDAERSSWPGAGERAALRHIGTRIAERGQTAADPADAVAADVLARCRWAKANNDGHPSGAWSTGEQLAVALVLADREHLDAMGYTPEEAAQRVLGGMYTPPADFGAWLTTIRAALHGTPGDTPEQAGT